MAGLLRIINNNPTAKHPRAIQNIICRLKDVNLIYL